MRLVKRLALVGVAVLAATGLTASPAHAWTPADSYTLSGILTMTLETGVYPQLSSCEHELDTTLNTGSSNTGTVNSVSPDPTVCATTIPNCTITVSVGGLPWAVSGVNTGGGSGTVTISGIEFFLLYSGPLCSWATLALTVGGAVTGAYDDSTGVLVFADASGLEVTASNAPGIYPVGTDVTLNGALSIQGGTIPSLT